MASNAERAHQAASAAAAYLEELDRNDVQVFMYEEPLELGQNARSHGDRHIYFTRGNQAAGDEFLESLKERKVPPVGKLVARFSFDVSTLPEGSMLRAKGGTIAVSALDHIARGQLFPKLVEE